MRKIFFQVGIARHYTPSDKDIGIAERGHRILTAPRRENTIQDLYHEVDVGIRSSTNELNAIEQIEGFFGNKGFTGIVAAETDGFRFGIVFDTAIIFDGNAVHEFGNQFDIIAFTIDFNDAHNDPSCVLSFNS